MITSGMLNHMSLRNSCRSVGACLYIDIDSMNTPSICSSGMSCTFRLGKVIGKYVELEDTFPVIIGISVLPTTRIPGFLDFLELLPRG